MEHIWASCVPSLSHCVEKSLSTLCFFFVFVFLNVHHTRLRTKGDRAVTTVAPRLWKCLPLSRRSVDSVISFRKQLETHPLKLAFEKLLFWCSSIFLWRILWYLSQKVLYKNFASLLFHLRLLQQSENLYNMNVTIMRRCWCSTVDTKSFSTASLYECKTNYWSFLIIISVLKYICFKCFLFPLEIQENL